MKKKDEVIREPAEVTFDQAKQLIELAGMNFSFSVVLKKGDLILVALNYRLSTYEAMKEKVLKILAS